MNWLWDRIYDALEWTTRNEKMPDEYLNSPTNMTAPQVALCVGHSRKIAGHPEGGALSHDNSSNEWQYNLPLAYEIRDILRKSGIVAEVISEYEGQSYGAAQRWLAGRLKSLGVTLALELHFNSADATANGHEWLYWHSSVKGRTLAESLNAEMCLAVPSIKTRGIKPKDSRDRGANFLSGTHCPAVICEPFFGSNPMDWSVATNRKQEIARGIANGILDYLD